MWKDFKEFIMRGNVIDLAIAVIIGAAFGAIVNSLVNDIVMPLIGQATGKVNFTDLFISLNGVFPLKKRITFPFRWILIRSGKSIFP